MNSHLSDAYRAYPLHPHHIVPPLDFNSAREVPDSHSWPLLDDYPSKDLFDAETIPVINLADPNAVKLMGRACETWGMFQVTNHGFPMRLLDDAVAEGRRLFALPAQQKLKALRSPDGSTGYGLARISPFFSKFMWHEGFTMMGSPHEHARQIWPYNYTRFCDVMEEYQKEMRELSEWLVCLMLSSLGLTREDVKGVGLSSSDEFIEGACTALQLNSYPACPDPTRAIGLVAHTDTSLFTILYQSDTSGLQIFREGVGWVTVPPMPGALIVSVGDLFHILSNARFPAVLHRALVNQNSHRLSIAYFYSPPLNTQIMPLSKLVNPGDVPRYRSLSWREYIGIKAKHLDKALSLVRQEQI